MVEVLNLREQLEAQDLGGVTPGFSCMAAAFPFAFLRTQNGRFASVPCQLQRLVSGLTQFLEHILRN